MKLIKKIQMYQYLYRKRKDWVLDWRLGAGYYNTDFQLGKIVKVDMDSGKQAFYRVIYIEHFQDPKDMVKFIYLDFLGYEGEKDIRDCSFREFIEIYSRTFNNEYYKTNIFGIFLRYPKKEKL